MHHLALASLLLSVSGVHGALAEDPPQLVTTWNVGTYPSGIAVDDAGLVFACHFYSGQIMVFSPSGTLLRTFGGSGTGDGQFINPEGIAFDPQGNVYVTDYGLHRVQKFTHDGNWIATWPFQLTEAQGIAVDEQNFVYLADRTFVRKLDADGNLILSWGGQGSSAGEFNAAQGVAIDSRGDVYVADSINRNVQKFTSDGTYITTFTGPWAAPGGESTRIQGIALDPADNLYVCALEAGRITKAAPDGTVVSFWLTTRPIFVAADRFLNVYVTSSVGASISKFSYPTPPVSIESTTWTAVRAKYKGGKQ